MAEIIDDKRFKLDDDAPILDANGPVEITMRVNAGVVSDIAIAVRDKHNVTLKSVGAVDGGNELPLSTGVTGGLVSWRFDPLALTNPRYVAWNIWANYDGPALQFTVFVEVKQGTNLFRSKIKCEMAASEKIAAVGDDWLWIGAPL